MKLIRREDMKVQQILQFVCNPDLIILHGGIIYVLANVAC